MCGERSHGGVVNGLNLEPDPLHINGEVVQFKLYKQENDPCFRMIIKWDRMVNYVFVCLFVYECLFVYLCMGDGL